MRESHRLLMKALEMEELAETEPDPIRTRSKRWGCGKKLTDCGLIR